MEKLDFAELHKEKLAVIFENIDILTTMKESDTELPPRFFKEITDDVILDYKAKIGILNKNTKFVTRELIKDFRLLRREQRRRQAASGSGARAKRSFTSRPPRSFVLDRDHTRAATAARVPVALVLPRHPVTL